MEPENISRRSFIAGVGAASLVAAPALLGIAPTAEHANEMHVLTGFRDLDQALGGFRSGELICLSSRPGVGKTALALNIACNAAQLSTHVMYFSPENSCEQLMPRLISSRLGVSIEELEATSSRSDFLGARLQSKEELREFLSLPLQVIDYPDLEVSDVAALSACAFEETPSGAGLIVIDCLQLLSKTRKQSTEQSFVAGLVNDLKDLAMELSVSILATALMSYDLTILNQFPGITDICGEEFVRDKADIIMLIDRSTHALETLCPDRPEWGTANILIEKCRDELPCEIKLAFDEETLTFKDAT